jgi:hypothetical protein
VSLESTAEAAIAYVPLSLTGGVGHTKVWLQSSATRVSNSTSRKYPYYLAGGATACYFSTQDVCELSNVNQWQGWLFHIMSHRTSVSALDVHISLLKMAGGTRAVASGNGLVIRTLWFFLPHIVVLLLFPLTRLSSFQDPEE